MRVHSRASSRLPEIMGHNMYEGQASRILVSPASESRTPSFSVAQPSKVNRQQLLLRCRPCFRQSPSEGSAQHPGRVLREITYCYYDYHDYYYFEHDYYYYCCRY